MVPQLFHRGTFQFLHSGISHNLYPWAKALAASVYDKTRLPTEGDIPALKEAWCGLLLFPSKRQEMDGTSTKVR